MKFITRREVDAAHAIEVGLGAMPKRYFDPEVFLTVGDVTVWHTYESGRGVESDSRLYHHYTLDNEQAETGAGTSNHFDVRDLTSFVGSDCNDAHGAYYHAYVILEALMTNPQEIPLAVDFDFEKGSIDCG